MLRGNEWLRSAVSAQAHILAAGLAVDSQSSQFNQSTPEELSRELGVSHSPSRGGKKTWDLDPK
jgi:hypothetical protein